MPFDALKKTLALPHSHQSNPNTSFDVGDEDAKSEDSNDLDEIWVRRSRI